MNTSRPRRTGLETVHLKLTHLSKTSTSQNIILIFTYKRSPHFDRPHENKETNVAHAPHHPEKALKFSQIHSKNGGCSAGIVNMVKSHLKDLGITFSL